MNSKIFLINSVTNYSLQHVKINVPLLQSQFRSLYNLLQKCRSLHPPITKSFHFYERQKFDFFKPALSNTYTVALIYLL